MTFILKNNICFFVGNKLWTRDRSLEERSRKDGKKMYLIKKCMWYYASFKKEHRNWLPGPWITWKDPPWSVSSKVNRKFTDNPKKSKCGSSCCAHETATNSIAPWLTFRERRDANRPSVLRNQIRLKVSHQHKTILSEKILRDIMHKNWCDVLEPELFQH